MLARTGKYLLPVLIYMILLNRFVKTNVMEKKLLCCDAMRYLVCIRIFFETNVTMTNFANESLLVAGSANID
jgi:hypothetical protein